MVEEIEFETNENINKLQPSDIVVWTWINHVYENGFIDRFTFDIKNLSGCTGISVPRCWTAIGKLKELGVISVEKENIHGKEHNVYTNISPVFLDCGQLKKKQSLKKENILSSLLS